MILKQLSSVINLNDSVIQNKSRYNNEVEKTKQDENYEFKALNETNNSIENLTSILRKLRAKKGKLKEKMENLQDKSGVFNEWIDDFDE